MCFCGYTITQTVNAATTTVYNQPRGLGTSTTISGLTAGLSYTFTLSIVNLAGSTAGTPVTVITVVTAPSTPATPTVTDRTTESIAVSWTAPSSNGGSAITSYTLQQATATGSFSTVFTGNALSFNSTGLTHNTTYRYQVAATNGASLTSSFSSIVTATTVAIIPPTVPGAPTDPQSTTGAVTWMLITWSASTSGGTPILSYTLQVDDGNNGPLNSVYTGATASFNLTNLQAATTYRVRVQATNAIGSSAFSGIASLTTLAPGASVPGAPGNPYVITSTATSILVSWAASAEQGASVTEYLAEIAQPNNATFVVFYSGVVRNATATGLQPLTQYSFRVRANSFIGFGPYSNIRTANTTAAAVTPTNTNVTIPAMAATFSAAQYTNTLTLQSGPAPVSVYWNILADNLTLEVAMTSAQTTGWLGFGLSLSGQMIPNGDFIIGSVGSGLITDYFCTDTRVLGCPSGMCIDILQGGTEDVLSPSWNVSATGGIVMRFRRLLNTGDIRDVVIGNGQVYMLWAAGSSSFVSYHALQRGVMSVNFVAGASSSSIPIDIYKTLIISHGALMTTAWLFLAIIGTFVARFLKRFSWWFPLHIALQISAAVLALIAVVLAAIRSTNPFTNATTTVAVVHAWLGASVLLLGALLQPVLGFVIDKLFDKDRKQVPLHDKLHWWIGRLSIAAAVANVFLGLVYYGAHYALLIATGGVLAVYIVAWLCCARDTPGHQKVKPQSESSAGDIPMKQLSPMADRSLSATEQQQHYRGSLTDLAAPHDSQVRQGHASRAPRRQSEMHLIR
eukprot:TRINITY_DN9247_c0_g1_i2.p1 TRINITY_DN9247_c0_g1~~TRINITY_DN9247_c0_g1_i2.p1  ORF type:complete len:792 (-),score=165.34 TRINITY_DN9247_c0_g1_i2:881-3256(-)